MTIITRLEVLKLTNSLEILKAINKHDIKHHRKASCADEYHSQL